MSNRRVTRDAPFEFTLPDASTGGESLSSVELAAEHDAVLVVLLRSHYCPLCREIVQSLAGEYQSFTSRSTAVVPVLPDQVERGAVWQRRYELPFPILADPDESSEGDRFDTFAPYQRYFGGLPGAVLFRAHEGDAGSRLEMVTTFGSEQPQDFPTVEAIREEIEACTRAGTAPETGPRANS